jgi:hypothetical protein
MVDIRDWLGLFFGRETMLRPYSLGVVFAIILSIWAVEIGELSGLQAIGLILLSIPIVFLFGFFTVESDVRRGFLLLLNIILIVYFVGGSFIYPIDVVEKYNPLSDFWNIILLSPAISFSIDIVIEDFGR